MCLDRALAVSKQRPGKQRQTQVDGRRVDRGGAADVQAAQVRVDQSQFPLKMIPSHDAREAIQLFRIQYWLIELYAPM